MTSEQQRFTLVLLLAVLASLTFGLGYASSNQNTYLVEGLAKLDPNFLHNDWFARETTHHHQNFSFLIVAIDKLGLSIGLTTVLLELLLRIVGFLSIYKIIAWASARHALPVFLFVLVFCCLGRTRTIMVTYLYAAELQPSTFGTTFTLLGLLYFFRSRYLISGALLALAGFMHANFLLLNMAVVGLAHLAMGPKNLLPRLAMQFAPLLLPFALLTPTLLEHGSSVHGVAAREILLTIRSPHHYLPAAKPLPFIPFTLWSVLGIFGYLNSRKTAPLPEALIRIHLIVLGLNILATLLTTLVFIPFVSQLFFWRLAPFSVLFSQILFFHFLAQHFACGEIIRGRQIALELVCAAALVAATALCRPYVAFAPLALALYFGLRATLPYRDSIALPACCRAHLLSLIGAAILAVSLAYQLPESIKRSTFLNGFPGKLDKELYAWCRTTPNDARFLTSPRLSSFRVQCGRAIVVDWKSLSVQPADVVEWHERMKDVSGLDPVTDQKAAIQGYQNMSRERLMALREKYDLSYAVFKQEARIPDFPIAFENKKYVVLDIAR